MHHLGGRVKNQFVTCNIQYLSEYMTFVVKFSIKFLAGDLQNAFACQLMSNDYNLQVRKCNFNPKLFMSPSGVQKDDPIACKFCNLCVDIERCYHFGLFDEQPSSLPKLSTKFHFVLKLLQHNVKKSW